MPKPAETKDQAVEIPDSLSFESAMKELEEIVRRLEGSGGDLESAIRDYQRGSALQRHCQKKLADARLRVDSILKTEGGISLQAFESEQA